MKEKVNWFGCYCIAGVVACMLWANTLLAQNVLLDSLRSEIHKEQRKEGFEKREAYLELVNQFAAVLVDYSADSTLKIVEQQIVHCNAINYKRGLADAWKIKGNAFTNIGNKQQALNCYLEALRIAEGISYHEVLTGLHNNLGTAYNALGNNAEALREYYIALDLSDKAGDEFASGVILNNIGIILFSQKKYDESAALFQRMKLISKKIADTIGIVLAYSNLAEIKSEQKQFDEALGYLDTAFAFTQMIKVPESLISTTRMMGLVNEKAGNFEAAKKYYRYALDESQSSNIMRFYGHSLLGLAKVERKDGEQEKAIAHASEALRYATEQGEATLLRDVNELLAMLYEDGGNTQMALQHFQQFKLYADSVNGLDAARAAATYEAEYAFSKKELAFQQSSFRQQLIIYASAAGILLLGTILLIINRHKRRLDRAYAQLAEKNRENEQQKQQLQVTLDELRRTQRQLIQSEKMASLGELTAGISHEIKNPLNFVNNFSEVSIELLEELMEAYSKKDENPAAIADIENDLKASLEKILHHGRKADAIVLAMLQHSRGATGTMETTDINSLVAENLDVALHEIKTKGGAKNIAIETDYDSGIPPIQLVQTDIGRVVLNLISNALYSLNEKAKNAPKDYQPLLMVTTAHTVEWATISIRDNGMGIPKENTDRIFQPFFTTKPTGEGTGLGLSLSYDIVKAHGGILRVVDNPSGMGAAFELLLQLK